MKVLQIGNGSMGKVILDRYKSTGKYDIDVITRSTELNLDNAMPTYDIILLAIKPQQFEAIAHKIKRLINENTVIVSILAGINSDKIRELTGCEQVTRVMPNMGMKYGLEVNLSADGDFIDHDFIQDAFGECSFCHEEDINTLTPITGCAPAYFLQMASVLVDIWSEEISVERYNLGLKNSYKSDVAKLLRTAAKMLEEDDDSEAWISKIASKGGVTEAVINYIKEPMRKIMSEGIKIGQKRADELDK